MISVGPDGLDTFVFQPRASVACFRATDPPDLQSVPSAVERSARGMVLKQTIAALDAPAISCQLVGGDLLATEATLG